MKTSLKFLILTSLLTFSTLVSAGWNPKAESEARATMENFKRTDSSSAVFFQEAYGYAIYPTVGKAGLGIGGAHGKGTLFEQGVAIGETTLTQLSFGFQWGGQAYSEVIFFENEEALDDFKRGNYEMGAHVSAVAITAGASASAAYSGGVAVLTLEKGGLMYEASVGGQKFSFKPKT